jgi:hypothetical protein
LNKILKWFPTIAGVTLFTIGLFLKLAEKPKTYDQFISGNNYILIVIGIEAIIINLAFNHILKNSSNKQE